MYYGSETVDSLLASESCSVHQ